MLDARAFQLALAHVVRDARGRSGLTQEACARLAGLSQNHFCRIELGQAAPAGVQISSSPTDGFALNTAWGPMHVQPLGLASAAESGVIVNGTTTVYPNVQQSTDSAVRPTALGFATYLQIRDASAPETFSWKLDLTYDEALRQLPDGSVAVVAQTGPADFYSDTEVPGLAVNWTGDPGQVSTVPPNPGPSTPYDSSAGPVANRSASSQLGSAADTAAQIARSNSALVAAAPLQTSNQWVIAVIRVPWAIDARQQALPTALSVHNDTITMTVQHRGGASAYPVIAAAADTSDCSPGHSPCGDFNAGKAVAYAYDWRNKRNDHYPTYDNDCTNFLSQIMRAGNMQMMREYEHGKGSWWTHDPPGLQGWDSTRSWTVANDFVHQMLQYRLAVYHRGDYRPGDILAWIWHADRDSTVEHLSITAYVSSSGMPYLLQHSTDYDVPKSRTEFIRRARADPDGVTPIRQYHLRPVHTAANIG